MVHSSVELLIKSDTREEGLRAYVNPEFPDIDGGDHGNETQEQCLDCQLFTTRRMNFKQRTDRVGCSPRSPPSRVLNAKSKERDRPERTAIADGVPMIDVIY
jgi:hypothetical protein